jgi:hypothetical protein
MVSGGFPRSVRYGAKCHDRDVSVSKDAANTDPGELRHTFELRIPWRLRVPGGNSRLANGNGQSGSPIRCRVARDTPATKALRSSPSRRSHSTTSEKCTKVWSSTEPPTTKASSQHPFSPPTRRIQQSTTRYYWMCRLSVC